MAQRLEDLVVRISGDTASLNRSVTQASRQVDGFARNASRSFSTLGSSIRQAAGALAAFGVATQLKSAVQSSLALADSLQNTSQRVGTTAEALQRLRAATEPAGVSAGKLDNALLRLSKNLGEAQQGGGALVKALEGTQDELLASLVSSDNSAEAFLRLADGIAKIESPTERARVAQAALGRGGVELVAVLAQGRDALEEVGDEAERLHGILSDDAVDALEAFGDAAEFAGKVALVGFAEGLVASSEGATSLTDALGSEEALSALSDFTTFIGKIAGAVGQLPAIFADTVRATRELLGIIPHVERAIDGVAVADSEIGSWAGGATGSWNGTSPSQVPGTQFGPPAPARRNSDRAPLRRSARRSGGGGASRRGGVEPDLSFLDTSNLLKGELTAFENANKQALEAFDEMVKRTGEMADDALATIERRAETFGDFLGGVVGNFVNGAETDWKRLAQSFIAQVLEMQVAAAASELFKIGSRAVAGATAGGAGGGLGGFLASILGAFSGFAEGGVVTRPTLALIGEAGESEAVIPLSKLRGMVGGGGTVVNIHNGTGAEVSTRKSRGSDGQDVIDVMVGSSLKRGHARGEFRQQFGQRHQPGVG